MRLTEQPAAGVNVIRGYSAGELRINGLEYRDTVIVSPSTLLVESGIRDPADLAEAHSALILDLQPELVLLGTGQLQRFPAAAFGASFLRRAVGFEVMDTGAACRTYNVLVGEQRRVVAVLMV